MRYLPFMVLAVLAALPLAAHAAVGNLNIWQGVTCNLSGQGPCGFCDMVKVARNIVEVLRNLTFGIAVIAIVAGAVVIMVSAGNTTLLSWGKSAIKNAIIGVVIAVVAWVIVSTVLHLVTGRADLPWNQIVC